MTLSRRMTLGLAAGTALSLATGAAVAQDWKAKYPELVYATIPAENASGVTERMGPWMAYLSRELGVKVTLRIAADYAAVIEGQRAGVGRNRLEIARDQRILAGRGHGPSHARTRRRGIAGRSGRAPR